MLHSICWPLLVPRTDALVALAKQALLLRDSDEHFWASQDPALQCKLLDTLLWRDKTCNART